jgi:hypothetical protein
MTQPISGTNSTSLFGSRPGPPTRWTVTDLPMSGHNTPPAPTCSVTNRVPQMAPATPALGAGSGANAELQQALSGMEGACGLLTTAGRGMSASACANPEAWASAACLLDAANLQPQG